MNSQTLLKSISFVAIILIASIFNAQASLIEADYLTDNDKLAVYDSESELTWLDLTLSTNFGFDEASGYYDGYRVATSSEVSDLFNNFFGELSYNNQGIYYDYDETAINYFIELFGITSDAGPQSSTSGFYLDDGTLKMTTVTLWDNADESNDDYLTDIYGTSYATNMNHYYDDGAKWSGIYMVKENITRVSEPSIIMLFLLSLLTVSVANYKKLKQCKSKI